MRKVISQIFILAIMTMLIVLPASPVLAVGPSVVGNGTSQLALGYPQSRNVVYASGLYWAFYSDGTDALYRTSSDGETWSDAGTIRSGVNLGYEISTWYDLSYFYYAYSNLSNNNTIYFRRGALETDGSVSWSTSEQTVLSPNASISNRFPVVAVDSNGYPWIGYLRVNSGGNNCPYVVKSSTYDGTWTTEGGFPYELNSADGSWYPSVVPFANGNVSLFYTGSNYLRAHLWNGSSWETEATTTLDPNNDKYYQAIAINETAAGVLVNASTSQSYYYTYNSLTNTFDYLNYQVILGGIAYPSLSKLDNGKIVAMGIEDYTGPDIIANYYDGSEWTGIVTLASNLTSPFALTSSYYQPYQALVLYVTGSGSPYDINFISYDNLPTPVLDYSFQISFNETTGTSYTQLPIIVSINNSYLIDQHFLSENCTDTRVSGFTAERPHLVVDDKLLFSDQVPASATYEAEYRNGYNSSEMYLLTGVGGNITTTDAAPLELGGNFSIDISGYFDTSGSDKNIVYKAEAYRVYVQAPGNIRATKLTAGDAESYAVDAAVSSGDHDLFVCYNGSSFSIFVDDVLEDIYNVSTTVTDNANTWYWLADNSTSYAEYIKLSVNGTQSLWYQPVDVISGTTLPDRSAIGGFQDGTINFGTNPAGISTSFDGITPVNLPETDRKGWTEYDTFVTTTPAQPSGMYTPSAKSSLLADIPEAMLAGTGIPVSYFWFLFPLILALVIGIFIHDKSKSLFAQFIVLEICLIMLWAFHIWPLWFTYVFAFYGMACCMAGKVQSY